MGKDYASIISSDNLALGMYLADALAEATGGKGDVAAMYYANDFYITRFHRYLPHIERNLTIENYIQQGGKSAADLLICQNTFDKRVFDGLISRPAQVCGHEVWDVRRIDSAFDALQGLPALPQAVTGE